LQVLLGRQRRERLGRLLRWLLRWLRGWLLRGLLGTRSIVTRLLLHGAASLEIRSHCGPVRTPAQGKEPSVTDPPLRPWGRS
jgi:hypothetical protein